MNTKSLVAVGVISSFLVLGGCTTYYKVSDVSSGKVYYTTDIEDKKSGGSTFQDASSGATVTLQSSEVIEVSSDEFKKNTQKK
jgi:hypothetical protein